VGLTVLNHKETQKWNEVIASYSKPDVYDLNEYVCSLLLDSKDEGLLFCFEGEKSRMCYAMIKKDIGEDAHFAGELSKGVYYDLETPYGYGGPLYDNLDARELKAFRKWLKDWCRENRIVSQFVRFHPLRKNAPSTVGFFDEVRYMHHTIFMDTETEDVIVENMDSKNRNMVRKARKNQVEIVVDEALEQLPAFKEIYKETMDYHNASEMYYFSDEYYDYLRTEMKDNIVLLLAKYEGKPISASLFFYNKDYMHYHLSGTLLEYRKLAGANLLLFEAACLAAKKGIKEFHLGGGLSEDDSLYGFKKQFSKPGVVDFYIGKTIFMEDEYRELLKIRNEADDSFNMDNNRMIQYRA